MRFFHFFNACLVLSILGAMIGCQDTPGTVRRTTFTAKNDLGEIRFDGYVATGESCAAFLEQHPDARPVGRQCATIYGMPICGDLYDTNGDGVGDKACVDGQIYNPILDPAQLDLPEGAPAMIGDGNTIPWIPDYVEREFPISISNFELTGLDSAELSAEIELPGSITLADTGSNPGFSLTEIKSDGGSRKFVVDGDAVKIGAWLMASAGFTEVSVSYEGLKVSLKAGVGVTEVSLNGILLSSVSSPSAPDGGAEIAQ